jgi:serine/threonine protein kinase
VKWLSDAVIHRLRSDAQSPDLAGSRYQAVKFLGRGGMGTVWLARDNILERNVALKVLALENSSPELAERLLREARVLAQLEHPGIVPVHDAGTLADGKTFYSMKCVEGETLDRYMAGASLRECLQVFERIAEPLAFAHARGIIHRDLKPGNIMVGAFGEVLIMDWGLARIIADQPSGEEERSATSAGDASKPQTSHGSVLGTPGYMSPEQAGGRVNLIDQRTDIFALGAILNDLLRNLPGGSPPKALVAIGRKAAATEISARYASVREMASDIRRYLEGLPVSAYRESLFERGLRQVRRHQAAIVLVIAYLVMRLLFILLSGGR